MSATCIPCALHADHVWHDDGSSHTPVHCDDLADGHETSPIRERREEICAAGHCTCEERRPMEGQPTPRTPRIEAGEKVVLPDGQVRKIKAVKFVLDHTDRDTTKLIVELTGRWLPNGD